MKKQIKTLEDEATKIYNRCFNDYDGSNSSKEVLDALVEIEKNPKLLIFVLKCLKKLGVSLKKDLYYIEVQTSERFPEEYEPLMIQKLFNSFQEAEKYAMGSQIAKETIYDVLFKPYSIKKI